MSIPYPRYWEVKNTYKDGSLSMICYHDGHMVLKDNMSVIYLDKDKLKQVMRFLKKVRRKEIMKGLF